jgi:hypothetical protein
MLVSGPYRVSNVNSFGVFLALFDNYTYETNTFHGPSPPPRHWKDGKPAMAVSADGKEILLHLPQGLSTSGQVSAPNLTRLKASTLYRQLYTKLFRKSGMSSGPLYPKARTVTVEIPLRLMSIEKAR